MREMTWVKWACFTSAGLMAAVLLCTNTSWAQTAWINKADRGVFAELNSKVSLSGEGLPPVSVVLRHGERTFEVRGGRAIGVGGGSNAREVTIQGFSNDLDGDGIPNQLDVLLGARKTVLNGARYEGGYERLAFPMGDVSRDKGVCTDMLVRALRNAGLDLQEALNRDIRARRRAYPMVKRPNPHIDHRRVKTLLPYFKHHFGGLSTSLESGDWLPGDVVFMDTLPKPGPDHVGIVSDRIGESGHFMVINNWTDGYHTADMDLLAHVPVTHRFRISQSRAEVGTTEQGLTGLLARHGLRVPKESTQALVVTTPSWEASRGTLRRVKRVGERWRQVGDPIPVSLGRAGLAWGRGVSTASTPATQKREGDNRSPAGVFRLGVAFGPQKSAPYKSRWPWRRAGPDDVWVDDPNSTLYNTWTRKGAGRWQSAETLSHYELALVVEHNTTDTKAGAGSAIFLHTGHEPTPGCTVMSQRELKRLISWLSPDAHPVLVQVSGEIY